MTNQSPSSDIASATGMRPSAQRFIHPDALDPEEELIRTLELLIADAQAAGMSQHEITEQLTELLSE